MLHTIAIKPASTFFYILILFVVRQKDFPHNAHHREIAISISNYTLRHGDAGLVIVGGRMEMQPNVRHLSFPSLFNKKTDLCLSYGVLVHIDSASPVFRRFSFPMPSEYEGSHIFSS